MTRFIKIFIPVFIFIVLNINKAEYILIFKFINISYKDKFC